MSSNCIKLYMDGFHTSRASNGTKNTEIGVQMTKLWPYKVGTKIGDCSNVATLQRVQKQSSPTSRRFWGGGENVFGRFGRGETP